MGIVILADLAKITSVGSRNRDRITMWHLTRQQQYLMGLVIFLLLTGWAVKAWRESHPSRPDMTETR